MKGVLAFECIGCVVAFQQILSVVEHHGDVGISVFVGQSKFKAASQSERDMLATWNVGLVVGLGYRIHYGTWVLLRVVFSVDTGDTAKVSSTEGSSATAATFCSFESSGRS